MNGGDHSTIKRALVAEPTPSVIGRGGVQDQIELFSETLAQLVSRAICKGDSDDLIDIEVVVAEDVQVTLNEDSGFSGARPGRHRDVLIDLIGGSSLLG